jgi:excisionase family DNA binding protein
MNLLTRYLTPGEVAERLGVDPKTVLRWAAQDATMPATRLPGGRVVRFEEQALTRWLARKTQRGRTAGARSLVGAPTSSDDAHLDEETS